MTYTYIKRILATGKYDKEDMLGKLDVFLLADRITEAQYTELIGMINAAA